MHLETVKSLTGILGCVLFLAFLSLPSSSRSVQGKSPKPSALATQGRTLFVNNCAACHGPSGQGGDGPSLHKLKLTDAKISSTILEGIKGDMPAFKSKLRAMEVKGVVAYLRTLK